MERIIENAMETGLMKRFIGMLRFYSKCPGTLVKLIISGGSSGYE